jgi:hypothetical protein
MQRLSEEVSLLACDVSENLQRIIDKPLDLSTVAQQSVDCLYLQIKETNIPILSPFKKS